MDAPNPCSFLREIEFSPSLAEESAPLSVQELDNGAIASLQQRSCLDYGAPDAAVR